MASDEAQTDHERKRFLRDLPAVQFGLGAIPVRIEAPFLLVAALLGVTVHTGATLVVAWVVVVLVSVLAHELGHAATELAFGARARVVLNSMGGRTYSSGRIESPMEGIVVGLAGPIAQTILLGLPALLLLGSGAIGSFTIHAIVRDVALVSLGWAAINLLPILPLDGGNIAGIVLRAMRIAEPERVARVISVGAALGLAIWAWQAIGVLPALWLALFAAPSAVALRTSAGGDRWSGRRSLRSIASSGKPREKSRSRHGDDEASAGRRGHLHGD